MEIRSASDYGPSAEDEIRRKRLDYFLAGTQVVWDVDVLRDERIRSYGATAPDVPIVFGRGEDAHAEPALPGWRFSVDSLWD